MNGETMAARFDRVIMAARESRGVISQGDTPTDPDRRELMMSDPALDELARAMTFRPLRLAGWATASVFRAFGRSIRRALDMEAGR